MTRNNASKQASKPASEAIVTRTVTLSSPAVVAGFVDLRATADAIVIRTRADHDDAGVQRDDVRRQLKLATAGYLDARRVMTEAITKHRQLENDKCAPALYFVGRVGKKILDWELEQDRKAEAKRKVADDEARAKAQREQDARVEELRRTAEATPTKGVAKRIDRQADVLEQQPVQATGTMAIDPGYSRVPGTSRREPWTGRVTDLSKVLALLAAGTLPATLIDIRQGELNRLAAQYQDRLEIMFPGLAASSEKKLAG